MNKFQHSNMMLSLILFICNCVRFFSTYFFTLLYFDLLNKNQSIVVAMKKCLIIKKQKKFLSVNFLHSLNFKDGNRRVCVCVYVCIFVSDTFDIYNVFFFCSECLNPCVLYFIFYAFIYSFNFFLIFVFCLICSVLVD